MDCQYTSREQWNMNFYFYPSLSIFQYYTYQEILKKYNYVYIKGPWAWNTAINIIPQVKATEARYLVENM